MIWSVLVRKLLYCHYCTVLYSNLCIALLTAKSHTEALCAQYGGNQLIVSMWNCRRWLLFIDIAVRPSINLVFCCAEQQYAWKYFNESLTSVSSFFQLLCCLYYLFCHEDPVTLGFSSVGVIKITVFSITKYKLLVIAITCRLLQVQMITVCNVFWCAP